jgi:hypothetical protein
MVMDLEYKDMINSPSRKLSVDWDYCTINNTTIYTVYLRLGNEMLFEKSFDSAINGQKVAYDRAMELYYKVRDGL